MKLSQLSLADYNQLDSIPVINQDLSATDFTPVANTYYRHTGATTDTFTQGVIYLYDTAYHKLGESGGANGAQGPTGPRGPQGEQGIQGLQGPKGDPGDPFVIIGTLANTSLLPDPTTVGRNTAYLIPDAAEPGTYDMYVITGDTTLAWENAGHVQSVQGPKGDPGTQGPTGPQGPQGVNGIDGTDYLFYYGSDIRAPLEPSFQTSVTLSNLNRTPVVGDYGTMIIDNPSGDSYIQVFNVTSIGATTCNITGVMYSRLTRRYYACNTTTPKVPVVGTIISKTKEPESNPLYEVKKDDLMVALDTADIDGNVYLVLADIGSITKLTDGSGRLSVTGGIQAVTKINSADLATVATSGSYNDLANIPVINQDLTASGFTPVANTYYRHTGATTDTFTQGVIYLYDTAYHKLGESGGGISDVKVNGTSVVKNGVANIPRATDIASGVVTNETQSIFGKKYFIPDKTDSSYGFYFDAKASSKTAYFLKINGNAYIGKKDNPMSAIFTNNAFIGRISKQNSTNKIDIPNCNGTMIVAPSTWNSGTSGTVKLTGSGTYQIYMNDGKNNINFGVVYWDGSADTYTQAVFNSAHSGYFATIIGGVITAYDLSITGDSTTANTYTIYYRRIGI